jgi:hypothetical protein
MRFLTYEIFILREVILSRNANASCDPPTNQNDPFPLPIPGFFNPESFCNRKFFSSANCSSKSAETVAYQTLSITLEFLQEYHQLFAIFDQDVFNLFALPGICHE